MQEFSVAHNPIPLPNAYWQHSFDFYIPNLRSVPAFNMFLEEILSEKGHILLVVNNFKFFKKYSLK